MESKVAVVQDKVAVVQDKVPVVQDNVPVVQDKVGDRVPAVPLLPVGVVEVGPVGLRLQDRVPVVREK